MGRYVIRRLLQMVPVFIGSTFLIFLMVYALGDPVAALFGDRAPDPATAAQIRRDLCSTSRCGSSTRTTWGRSSRATSASPSTASRSPS